MHLVTFIRSATTADADTMTALAHRSKAMWGYSAEFMRACRDEMAIRSTDIDKGPVDYVVLESGATLLGFYGLQRSSASQFELDALYVEPDQTGQNYGRQLLAHAIDSARQAGAERLLIQSDPHATGFYLAAGAIQTGTLESGSIPGRLLPLLEIAFDSEGGK